MKRVELTAEVFTESDRRVSAISLGVVGILVPATVLLLAVACDVPRLLTDLKLKVPKRA